MIILAYAAFVAFAGLVSGVNLRAYHPLLEARQVVYQAWNSTSDLAKRQGVCPSNYVPCGPGTCSPIGWNCCSNGDFCAPDKYCDAIGCCPNGEVCSGLSTKSDTAPPPDWASTSFSERPPSPTVDKPTPTLHSSTIDFTSRLSSISNDFDSITTSIDAPVSTFQFTSSSLRTTPAFTTVASAASAVSSPSGGLRSGARSTSLRDCGMKLLAIAAVVVPVLTVFAF